MPDRSQGPGHGSVPARLARASDRALAGVEAVTLLVSCVALFLIMVILFLDGALRYLANSPLTFAMDMVTLYLLSAALLLVASYTLRQGGHINVDLFMLQFSRRTQALLFGAGILVALPILVVMGYQLTLTALESWHRGETLIGLHAFPLWLSSGLVATSFVVLCVRALHLGLCNVLFALTGDPDLDYLPPSSEGAPEKEAV